MIPYEELVAALDRYIAKNGGTPMSARASASSASPSFATPARVSPPVHDDAHAESGSVFPSFDEHHDPDLPHEGGEDATHVGASPGAGASLPPPLAPVGGEDHSNEIDIGDVLTDDEM